MSQVFAINGTNISRLTTPNWLDSPGDAQTLAGYTPLVRWRRLVVSTSVLSASEFNSLRALEGARVSVTAPPYDDRNAADWKSYYGAVFERLSGRHDGPNVESVTAEFLVRV